MSKNCPFCEILQGEAAGTVIARDDEKRFALIQNIHPEGAIHWLAMPYEHVASTEVLEQETPERFVALMEFAVAQTKARREEFPALRPGFTVKLHFGSYETIPHAKLHILSKE